MTFATTRRMGELYQWGKCPRTSEAGRGVSEGVLVPQRLEGKEYTRIVYLKELFEKERSRAIRFGMNPSDVRFT